MAFALICSDAAFGDLPVTSRHSDFDAVRVGDILRVDNDTHSVIVLERRSDSVIVAEGNYNSSIHWGRELTRQQLEAGNFTAESRYPASVGADVGLDITDPEEEQQPEELPEDVTAGLSDEEGARAAIINALVQRESELDLSSYGLSYTQLSDLMDSILQVPGFDNYYGFSTYWHHVIDTSKPVAVIELKYLNGAAEILEQNRELEAEAERVVAQVVTAGMSDYDIAKALHDYLVLNCAYDYDNYRHNTVPSESYTAYGALIKDTAVCAGYALAYEYLLQLAGIPAEYVSGYAGGGHACQ